MTKGKTILELMQEQEPLNGYDAEDICLLYCNDGPMPCVEKCSWFDLFTKRRFVEVSVADKPTSNVTGQTEKPSRFETGDKLSMNRSLRKEGTTTDTLPNDSRGNVAPCSAPKSNGCVEKDGGKQS